MDHDSSAQSLQCTICAKVFTNKKSQTRHIAYCRKSIGRVRSRKRACQACAKAKARCDIIYPCCSRCSLRGIKCDYTYEPRSQYNGSPANAYLDLENMPISNPINFGINIDIGNLDSCIQTLSNNQVSKFVKSYKLLQNHFEKNGTNVYSDQILFSSAQRYFTPRSLGLDSHISSLQKKYLLCTLRSYPRMMLQGQNPPFIHKRSLASNTIYSNPESSEMNTTPLGPLTVCDELLRLYTMRNDDNVCQIWRAIRMEQERLLAEYHGYDHRDTLAALQSVSMYFVLRVFERDEKAANFDIQLVQTMLELAIHLTKIERSLPKPHISQWEDWVLAESSRRTHLFLHLINMLFEYTQAVRLFHHCQGYEMLALKLPSTRNLWRANSETEWEREYKVQCRRIMPCPHNKRVLTYSDLLEDSLRNDGSLDFWLSDIDEFGNLMIAAASL